MRGRYSIIGLEPDLIFRVNGTRAEINRAARTDPDAFAPVDRCAARGAAWHSRRKPYRAAGRLAANGGRRFRLSRLRHGAADGGFAAALARSDRHSRCDSYSSDVVVVFDAVKDTITIVTPVRPHAGRDRRRWRWRAPPSGIAPSSTRSTGRSTNRAAEADAGAAPGGAAIEHHARRIQAHGAARQGIHRRRRYFSGGAVAALRSAVRAAAVFALPRAAPGQSLALSVLPRFRRLRDRRLEPGNSGQSRATARSPSARSPAPARAARPRTRTWRWRPSCWPTPRSAPSI